MRGGDPAKTAKTSGRVSYGRQPNLGSAVQDAHVSLDIPAAVRPTEDARAHCRLFLIWYNNSQRCP